MIPYIIAKCVCWLLDPFVKWQNTNVWYWTLRTIHDHELGRNRRVYHTHGARTTILTPMNRRDAR